MTKRLFIFLRKKHSSFSLKLFNVQSELKERRFFLGTVFKNGVSGVLWSILIVALLFFIDYFLRFIIEKWSHYPNESWAYELSQNIFGLNKLLGIKNVDYLSEVISLGAGILGVLLGLFYTVFVTIVSTKYSNVNSEISVQLIQQKTLNRYFVLLATLTSVSVIFQFLMALGYRPTIVSFSLFTMFVAFALTSFVKYGRYFFAYFDSSFLANEIFHSSEKVLRKIAKRKKHISQIEKGRHQLFKINQNLESVRAIIIESGNPQTSNTSLDSISNQLLKFSLKYFQSKHIIPKDGWHIQIQKIKTWDDASGHELNLLKDNGVAMIPETLDSFNFLDKKIIDIQFELFENLRDDNSELVSLLHDQQEMLQIMSIQCETEVTKHFFTKLEDFILKKIEEVPKDNDFQKLQLVSVIPTLMIQHLVGFNHNLRILQTKNLKKLAFQTHKGKSAGRTFTFPYFLRIWCDDHRMKIEKEKFYEDKVLTPLFYTELDLARIVRDQLQDYCLELTEFCESSTKSFSEKLTEMQLNQEVIALNIWSQQTVSKMAYMAKCISDRIIKLNDLNFQKDSDPLEFEKYEQQQNAHNSFKEFTLEKIWDYSIFSSSIKSENVSDLFGTTYQLLHQSLLDSLLSKEFDDSTIASRLIKFNAFLIFYQESVRKKASGNTALTPEQIVVTKLYPIVKDLYEVNGIAIIISRLNDKSKLEEAIFSFLDSFNFDSDKELEFWKKFHSINQIGSSPVYMLSSSSYEREHFRSRAFEDYIINHPLISKECIGEGMFKSFMERYVVKVDDLYVKAFVSSLDASSRTSFFQLEEIFIEFYLRTRISLKTLNLKESNYGERIRRVMEGD